MTEQKKNFLLGITTGSTIALLLALIAVSGSYYAHLGSTNNEPSDKNNNKQAKVDTARDTGSRADNVKLAINEDDHFRGPEDAPITIIEFSDFQCPYCSRFHNTLVQAMEEYPNDIKWVFKHFPLDRIHPYARKAAEAAECAGDQDKFWEYNDGLFNNQRSINSNYLSTLAKEIGLDVSEFEECLDSGKYEDKVQADFDMGKANGISGTPGWFINGQKVGGAVPYEQISSMIESFIQ